MGLPEQKTLDQQLKTLAEIGFVFSDDLNTNDLLSLESRASLEQRPYFGIFRALGMVIDREPFTPKCANIWTCDLERIARNGDYAEIIRRLDQMTSNRLAIQDVCDSIDLAMGHAEVSFCQQGLPLTWQVEVDDHWVDESVFRRFDQLLESADSACRIYRCMDDDGLSTVLLSMQSRQQEQLSSLIALEFILCSQWSK